MNAPQLAADRGVQVEVSAAEEAGEHANLVTVRGAPPDGRTVSVGRTVTVTGVREVRKLVEVDGFDLDLPVDGVQLFLGYTDRPGVVGTIGTTLGRAGVNIAAMQVARRAAGGQALMVLTVDSAVDAELLAAVAAGIGAHRAAAVDLRS